MLKILTATLLVSAMIGGAALAQTTTPLATGPQAGMSATSPSEMGMSSAMMQSQNGFYTYQQGNQMLGSGLMGARVVGAGNENIGEVDDLLLDRNGQVVAIVVGVGGFLGIGEKDVAIANDQLEFVLGQDAAAGAGSASTGTGTATAPGMATTSPTTGAGTAAGTAPATGTTAATGTAAAPGTTTTPGGAATGTGAGTGMGMGTTGAMAPANGTATGMMGNGWGWSGAGIDHIQVNFTREQLESAPAFETAE